MTSLSAISGRSGESLDYKLVALQVLPLRVNSLNGQVLVPCVAVKVVPV